MAWYWIYILGVITPFVAVATFYLIAWCFSKSGIISGGSCGFCEELGWRTFEAGSPVIDYSLPEAAWGAWHKYVRARRLSHRILWQKHADRWGRHSEKNQRRFGTLETREAGD